MHISCRTLLAALAGAAMTSVLAAVTVGCASSDCSETATCSDNDNVSDDSSSLPETAEGDVVGDQAFADRSLDAPASDVINDFTVDQEPTEDTTTETTAPDSLPMPDSGGSDADAQVGSDVDAIEEVNADAADSTVLRDVQEEDVADADATLEASVEAGPDAHDANADVVDASPDVADDVVDAADAPEEADAPAEACNATPGFECVPAVPSGWTGPVTFWTAANGSAAPPCQTALIDAYEGLDASSDTCQCGCMPSGVTCSATAQVYSDLACAEPCAAVAEVDSGCNPLQNATQCGSQGSFVPTQPEASGGTCVAQFVQMDAGPPTWATAARLCSATATGDMASCSSAAQCMPAPSAPYTSMCVYQNGTVATCPTGFDHTGPTVLYRDATDDRGCSECTCAAALSAAGTCTGSVSLYGGTDCAGTAETFTYEAGVACPWHFNTMAAAAGSVQGVFTLADAGACGAPTAKSQPEGGVVGANPLTVCCM